MSAYILKGTKNRLPSARYYTIPAPLFYFAPGLGLNKAGAKGILIETIHNYEAPSRGD